MPGSLDEATIAAKRSAPCGDAAVGARRVVRPDDHRAAIADFSGIGFQRGVGAEVADVRVLHIRVLALVVATDQDPAAAAIGLTGAAGIDFGLVHDRDAIAQHFDAAAPGAGGDDAAVAVDIGVLAGLEENAAALADHAAGIDRAAVPDDDAGDADAAGFRRQGAEVGGIAFGAGDVDLDAGGGAVDQAHGSAGGEDGFTLRRGDDAFVGDVAADQIDAAAGGGADFALVDDALRRAVVDEDAATGEEVGIADVEGAGDEGGDVDLAAGADHDAGGVHQPDAAVGTQGAVDGGRVVQYPVEHRTGGGGLGEVCGLAGLDGELLPVDDGAGGVGDRQNLAGLIEGGGAIDDRGVQRIGQDRGAEEARGHRGCAEADGRGEPGGPFAGRMLVAHVTLQGRNSRPHEIHL